MKPEEMAGALKEAERWENILGNGDRIPWESLTWSGRFARALLHLAAAPAHDRWEEAIEAACSAVCKWCEEKWPLERNVMDHDLAHVLREDGESWQTVRECHAVLIRALSRPASPATEEDVRG